jgi:exonuclease SbcC
VFDKLKENLDQYPLKDKAIVVICGDIFHFKIKLHPQDIDDFNYLIKSLEGYPIIIIPGNHDGNVNNPNEPDLISPLICNHKSITYLKDTGIYELFNRKFYHISVFDTEISETTISNTIKENPDSIMLYHGPVNGAKYKNCVESHSKIAKDVMKLAKICLLGDIHEAQFIMNNAAYPGSLIQQNMNEDLNKGFIIWDVNKVEGVFKKITNDYGLIKTDVSKMDYDEAISFIDKMEKPKNINRWSIHYSDDRIINYVKEKYEIAPELKRITPVLPKNKIETQVEVLNSLLVRDNVSLELREKILSMHKEYFGIFNNISWHIVDLKWDNLFKYGEDNYIDFRKINSICSIVAPNCSGKSSIFDIIVLMLFNVNLRGTKKSIIKKGKSKARCEIKFIAADKLYKIIRNFDISDNTKNIQLFEKCNEEFVNITECDIIKTYRVICTLIGDKDEFLTTNMRTQHSDHSVVYASNSARIEILSKIFGLTSIDKIKLDVDKKIKEIEKKLKEVPAATATDIENQIYENIQIISNMSSQIEALNNSLNYLTSDLINYPVINCKDITQEMITTTEKNISLCNEQLNYINGKSYNEDCTKPQYEISICITDWHSEMKGEIDEKYNALQKTCDEFLCGETNIKKVSIKKTNLLKKQIVLEQILKGMKFVNVSYDLTMYEQDIKELEQFDGAEEQLLVETNILNSLLSVEYKFVEPNLDLEKELEKRVEGIKTNSKLQFNNECGNCKKNIHVLNNELATCQKSLQEIKKSNKLILENYNKELLEKNKNNIAVQNAKKKIEQLREKANTNQKLKEIVAKKDQLEINSKIKSITSELDEIKKQIEIIDKFIADYTLLQKMKNAKDYRMKIDKEKLIEMTKKYKNKMKYYKEEINKSNLYNKNLIINNEIREAINEKIININKINQSKGAKDNLLEYLNKQKLIEKNYVEKAPPLIMEMNKYVIYKNYLMSNSEFKHNVVRNNLQCITATVNSILSSFTDFSVECYHDKSIIFMIKTADIELPIDMASGYQRFIVDIVFRHALNTFYSSQFLFIDEGFGGLDSTNLGKINDLFNHIIQDYKFIFIISHIIEIQQIATEKINLVQNDEGSRIMHGIIEIEAPIEKPKEIKITPDGKFYCECGELILNKSKYSHRKTKKHLNRLKDK